jgi:Holliday junction resolvasome RuvABC DNA-binding subunit
MHLAVPVAAGAVTGATPTDRLREDLLSALQNLGYHRPQAEKAIDAALKTDADASFEQALRGALREMMKH